MEWESIERCVAFLQETEQLKSTLRTAWTAKGRQESTAEHSWRLAVMAAAFMEDYPRLDGEKALKLCLLHDIGELYEGDVSAALLPNAQEKQQRERRGAQRAFSRLPSPQREEFFALWEEYEAGQTAEVRLVRALDKAETILQHNQGKNPPDFDYAFNLDYGAKYFEADETLRQLRQLLNSETGKRIREKTEPEGPAEGAVVYHASQTGGLKTLTPRRSTHGKAWVYGVENPVLALLFGAPQDDFDFLIDLKQGLPVLYECYPGAFQLRYQGRSCFLYEIAKEGFLRDQTGWEPELVCERPAPVIRERRIEDLHTALTAAAGQGLFRLHPFENTPAYRAMVSRHVMDRLVRFNLLDRVGEDERFSRYYGGIVRKLREAASGQELSV